MVSHLNMQRDSLKTHVCFEVSRCKFSSRTSTDPRCVLFLSVKMWNQYWSRGCNQHLNIFYELLDPYSDSFLLHVDCRSVHSDATTHFYQVIPPVIAYCLRAKSPSPPSSWVRRRLLGRKRGIEWGDHEKNMVISWWRAMERWDFRHLLGINGEFTN